MLQYPSYDGGHELGTFHSDVAIMKLENADFGAANIIELAENDKEDYSNADADIVGWGKTSGKTFVKIHC